MNDTYQVKKIRDKLIRLLAGVQDAGQKWSQDEDGCQKVDDVRNALVADFLIGNGVGFATENNVGCKTATRTKQWVHESVSTGNIVLAYSRCPMCGGSVEGYVNYRYCPYCGDMLGK